jgi:hypothetical protein
MATLKLCMLGLVPRFQFNGIWPSAEALVLSVPAVEKDRYHAVQLTDGNTFNYGHLGSRATGNDAGDYMIVGPNWKGETPAGIKRCFDPRPSSR